MPAENLVLTLCGRENRSHPFWPNTSKPRRVCQADFDRFRKRDLILEFLWNLELVPLSVLSAASCSKSVSICTTISQIRAQAAQIFLPPSFYLSVCSVSSCKIHVHRCPSVVNPPCPRLCCYPASFSSIRINSCFPQLRFLRLLSKTRMSQKHLLASGTNRAYVRVAVAMRTLNLTFVPLAVACLVFPPRSASAKEPIAK